MDADIADHVLAHVVDGWMGGVGGIEIDGMERGVDEEVGLRGEGHAAFWRSCGGGWCPLRGIEAWLAPAALFEACVVGLTTIDFGEGDGRGCGEPAWVCDDGLMRAVDEGQVQLGKQQVRPRGVAEAIPG